MLLSLLFFFMSRKQNIICFFFSSRRRHTRSKRDWSSDVCSSDLDLRLFTIDCLSALDDAAADLARALIERAKDEVETVMPGYTHLQRAQVVSLAHHLLAHVEPLRRDRSRIAEAKERAAVSPLGAGALAGVPYPVDPEGVAKDLGLGRTFRN